MNSARWRRSSLSSRSRKLSECWRDLESVIRITLFIPLALCFFVNAVFSQKLAEPRLIGSWGLGSEDYGEFLYHRVEQFASYLKDDPNGKIVARLCSSSNMPVALASSDGFAYAFPGYAEQFQAPPRRIFFARWSKCESKSEQYWFVPENGSLEYDEMIPAERVRVNRLLVSYYENPNFQPAKIEFAKCLKDFIAELKNSPKTEGFIIRNMGMSDRPLNEALRQLRKEKVGEKRFQILRKRTYRSYYPEFMTVTITE